MLAAILITFFMQQAAVPAPSIDGHGAPTVQIPRIESEAEIDGRLDESAWQQAARLSGFSQYQPVDGRFAEERTEVLVWYAPTALYFGILAYDSQPGAIRATIADRDKLGSDDTVTLFLDTFNDRRRAFVFGVNPLGIQQDGVQTEGAFSAGSLMPGSLDLNPDFKYESRGRITSEGYVVEIRIPFKSLRYPGNGPQHWGFNVMRKVQRTGYQDTWTDVRRASASFLGQSGALDGLHDLKRGVVLEAQPFVTATSNGSRGDDGGFSRNGLDVNPGVNMHFGFTNLSLDATANPDFSQVESDAGLVTVNERFALFYPEKRPFFLEGIELFSTPGQLVYTRKIVDPIAGAKVTGKFGPYGIAYLSAVDETSSGNATFNIARVRRDIGEHSLAGVTYTDRLADGDINHVIAADMRYVFGKLYYVQGQAGASWNDIEGVRNNSPIWAAEFDRTGRAWGFNYKLTGIGESFTARAGYVPRNNIVEGRAFNRFSIYGKRGSRMESVTVFFGPDYIWNYHGFGAEAPIEGGESVNVNMLMRGGWMFNLKGARQFFRFDQTQYDGYAVRRPDGTSTKFIVPKLLSGSFSGTFAVTTPTYRVFNGLIEIRRNNGAIFQEAADGNEMRVTTGISIRPTESIRVETTDTISHITRVRNGSEFARTVIPRLKVEYQPRRSLFFRVVAEYRSQRQSALEDNLSGNPIIINGIESTAERFNGLRMDLLASYQPTPGTVAFLGYGNSLETESTFGLTDLRRINDGFFIKLAYLFRH